MQICVPNSYRQDYKVPARLFEFPARPDDLSNNAHVVKLIAAQIQGDGILVIANQNEFVRMFLNPFDHDGVIDADCIDGAGQNIFLLLIDQNRIPFFQLGFHAVAKNVHQHKLV